MLSRLSAKTFRTFLPVVFTLFSFSAEAYEIKVQIEGVRDTSIILGHYFNKSMYPDDTAFVDSHGRGVFRGKKPLDQGMYVIYLPSGHFFQLMMGNDQQFFISTDTSDFVKHARIEGSADNEIFFDFQQYMVRKQAEISSYQQTLREAESEDDKDRARKAITGLTDERKQKIRQITADHPDLFVSVFLMATMDIEVPDAPKKPDGSIDSSWQYNYYRHHYFDNFNPADGRLLRTPLYEDKIMYYLEKVVPQLPDTLINEVDFLLEGARGDSALFRYLLITLFNYYGKSNIMGMDAVQVHLAEKYYLTEAWWSDEEFLEELRERVSALKPLLLGSPAPDVELVEVPASHFMAAANDTALKRYPHAGQLKTLSAYDSDFIVLFFWEATCSHCKKAVPEMYKVYKDELEGKGVTVLAISTLFGVEGKEKWIDFVNKHETYDWINAWNPYDYKFKVVYDIRSTPQIFILNRQKEIIAKRLGPEQVAGLIEAYRKQKN